MRFFKKITDWYLSKEALPYWVIFIIDCAVVFLSAIVVYALNNGTLFALGHFAELCGTLAIYLVIYIFCFHWFHTYVGVVRYSSFVDLKNIGFAMFTAVFIAALFKYVFANQYLFPIRMRDIMIWTVLALVVICMIRVIVKYWFDSIYNVQEAIPTYVYGVKRGGVSLAKSIRSQKPSKYRLMGFVTDEPQFVSYTLMGVDVHFADDHILDAIKRDGIKAIFVSPMMSETLRENQDFINTLLQNDVKIFMMPQEQEWGVDTLSHSQLREVAIEDLLPRDTITVNMEAIGSQLSGKRILITGAAGSIGSEIVTQVANFNPSKLVLIDQAETPLHNLRLRLASEFPSVPILCVLADITDRSRMQQIFEQHSPEYVFHAAAYKHVPMVEDNPRAGIHNNVIGTRIIADLAVKYHADKFVMISTDKAVNPTNVMGCSKRICEIYVQSLDRAIKEGLIDGVTQFVTTRFGNVLGSNGSVIPLFREQIRCGGPVTVTHPEIIRYFMLISEACKLVLEAATMGNGGEIFVFDMGQPVKIVDLARQMIKLSGADVEIKFTGLRNGEKLYEEVLADKEITLPTFHPKIKIARVRKYDFRQVLDDVEEIERNMHTDDSMDIVRRMKIMVPEFRSQHSVYEIIDRELQAECPQVADLQNA